jgi:hypothetical protein
MSAVSQVLTWRPVPDQAKEFFGKVAKAKAIHERMGCTVNIASSVAGGEVGTVVYMMTFESGAAYGVFTDALEADQEWVEFWAGVTSGKPSATLVSSALYRAVEGL